MKKTTRGRYKYRLDKSTGIVVCRWNDNSVVTAVSNHTSVFRISSVKGYSQKQRKHINIEQPKLIKTYNGYMGGVDRSDRFNHYDQLMFYKSLSRIHPRQEVVLSIIFTLFGHGRSKRMANTSLSRRQNESS